MSAGSEFVGAWDKIIGGGAGFMVGGPLGAFLGAIAGHLAGRTWREFLAAGDAPAAKPVPAPDDPYGVLGLRPDARDDEVKAAHRRLAWRLHPDRVAASEDPAAVAQASERLARINDAYDRIRRMRQAAP